MFVKDFEKIELLYQLEALENRIVSGHHLFPDIHSETLRRRAGYRGEQTVYYHLQQLPTKDVYIFHNLRIPNGTSHFQIDFLLLTLSFGLIIESKNFGGLVHFDSEFGQMIRKKDGEENGYDDPTTQAEHHRILLLAWIRNHFEFSLPIEWLVVFSFSSTILSTDPGKANLYRRVIHADKLLGRVYELFAKYRVALLDNPTIKKLNRSLLKAHEPQIVDILSRFRITAEAITRGVQCEKCRRFGMERTHGKWKCSNCGFNDEFAHVQSLKEYFYIMKKRISNKEFREFMNLDSPDVAKRLLTGLNLVVVGDKKGRIYLPPKRIEDLSAKK